MRAAFRGALWRMPMRRSICAGSGFGSKRVALATLRDESVDYIAVYPGMSLSLTFEARPWALSPRLCAEWSADGEFCGVIAMLYAQRPLDTHKGLDIIVAAMHDQAGDDWENAEYL